MLGLLFVEGRCIADGRSHLLAAILDGGGRMGGVLWGFWEWVTELAKGGFDILGHGDVEGVIVVVPVEGDPTVEGAGPVGGAFVVLVQGIGEVLCMFESFVFNAEVVDDKGELDWSPCVSPESLSEG